MRKKNHGDVLTIFSDFQQHVLNNKPDASQMYDEIRMMGYKVKPVTGDVSDVNLKNSQFIEILWSMGKLDEFFNKHIEMLPTDEQTVMQRIFDTMYGKFQEQLNAVNLKQERMSDTNSVFEMEIYKDKSLQSN